MTSSSIRSGMGRLPHMNTVIRVSARPKRQRPVVLCMRPSRSSWKGGAASYRVSNAPQAAYTRDRVRAFRTLRARERPPVSFNMGVDPLREDAMTENTPRYVSRYTQGTLALVLAGGRGARLKHLTLQRAKPATPFGGKFRIIDFPLSNCVNSGIRRIGVLTQYKSHSLIRHLQRGWSFLDGRLKEFMDLLPASQRVGEDTWYQGTADAVYQNMDILKSN